MANNIRGITIELGGNTGPLTSALKDVNKTSGDLQRELSEVNRQLKFDPKNATLLQQKEELLSQTTQALKEKQATLKEAVDQAHAAFEKGDLGADKVRAVEREYEKTASQLKDTEKQLNDVQKTSGTVGERIKATFTDMGNSIKKAFTWDNIKNAIGGIGIAAGAFLKSSLEEAGEAEKAQKNLEQTLISTKDASGMTTKSLDELTESLMKSTTFSDDQIKSGEGMLLTFTNIGKNVFPQATAALLDMSQKMGTDTSQQAMQLGKALNDPVKGITALTRVGVTFTAQQKDQIAQMVKTGDTAGAQKVILQELNKEFGGQAAAAADTFEGKQKQLENQMEELKESIGSALIPILITLGGYLVKILQPIAEFISAHPKITLAILGIVAVLGTLIGGLSLANTVAAAFGVTLTANQLLMTGGIMLAIMAIAAAAVLIVTHWGPISAFFENLWKTVSDAFVNTWNNIKTFFTNLFAWIGSFFAKWGPLILAVVAPFIGIPLLIIQHWGQISTFFVSLWNGIRTGLTTAWNAIRMAIMAIITPMIAAVQAPFNTLKTGISNILNGIKEIFSGVWTVIKNVVLGIVLLFIDLITGNFTKLQSDLTHILTNISNAFSQIWNGIKTVFVGIWQAISGAFGIYINEILAVARAVGGALSAFFSGLWDGIRNTTVSVWNALVGFFSGLPSRIGNIMNSVGSWVRSVWDGLVGFIASVPGRFQSGLSGVGNAVRSAFSSAISFITSLPSQALQWGRDIINGIVDGIKNAASAVGDAVKGVAQDIRKFLHFSEPDEGPLVGFHSWWKEMMYGMADDITSNMAPVLSAAQQVAQGVAGGIKIPATALDTGPQVNAAMTAANGGAQTASKSGTGTDTGAGQSGGGTPTFVQQNTYNSPKALSPAEAARQTRNATRQFVLALQKG